MPPRKKVEPVEKSTTVEWQATFDAIQEAVTIHAENYNIVKANKTATRILGMSVQDACGHKCYELVHGTKEPWPDCPHKLAMERKEPVTREFFEPHLGRHIEVTCSPIFSKAKKVSGSVHIVKDVTDNKKAEEALCKANDEMEKRVIERTRELVEANKALNDQRQLFVNVLDMLPAYMVLLSPDYHVPFANKFFRERFGESYGKRCFEYLFNRTEACENCETYTVMKTDKPHHWEWAGPDGHNYDIFDFPFTDIDGSKLIMEVGIDITDFKKAQADLRKAHDDLEIRVKERTRELTESEEKLRHIYSTMNEGLCVHEVVYDTGGKAVDYKIIDINTAYEKITGLSREKAIGMKASQLYGTGKPPYLDIYSRVAETGEPIFFETYFPPMGKHFRISTFSPERGKFATVFSDITEHRLTEEAIKESEERLKRSQEIAHLGSWELDLVNNRLTWSDEVYRIFGLKPQEFGATYEAFLEAAHPDDREAVNAAYFGSVRDGKDYYEIEHRIVRKSTGEVRFVHEKCAHFRDNSGKIIRSVGMVHDITERKQAEDRLAYLASFPKMNPNPIVELNSAGEVTFANPSAKQVFPEIEQGISGIGHRFLSGLGPVLKACTEGREERLTREIRVNSAWYLQSISCIKEQVRIYSMDITDRVKAEQAIISLNQELQRKSADLEAANNELEAFTYSVSHDLRAPLRSLDGFSQALLEDYSSDIDEEGKDYLNRIRQSSQLMGRLIDDLLRLSRLTRAQLKMEPVNLSQIADEVASELKRAEPDRKVSFCIAKGLTAIGDRQLLKIVFDNLLANAWKFTAKCENATIEVNIGQSNGKPAYFVRDNGCGFNKEYAGKLFKPFQRLHSVEEYPGTGIGLATVARIIAKHGGQVSAEGELGKGATIFFTLGKADKEK